MKSRSLAAAAAVLALAVLTSCASGPAAAPRPGAGFGSDGPAGAAPGGSGPNTSPKGTQPSAATNTPANPPGGPASAPSGLVVVPNLPGDGAALAQALATPTPVRYLVRTASTPVSGSKTAFLDEVLAREHWPASDMLVVILFPDDRYDIRFAMGALFRRYQVSVEDILELVRNRYQPRARAGDPAGGLADLIQAVNRLIP